MKKHNQIYKMKQHNWLFVILLIIITFPMIIVGIMCNDELLLRVWSQQGIKGFFYNTIFVENISKGRILGAVGSLKFLGYMTENIYINRIIEIFFLEIFGA